MFCYRGFSRSKASLFALSIAVFSMQLEAANAQSTPTELASLSLEDLLEINVTTDVSKNKHTSKWGFAYSYRRLSVGGYKIGTTDVTFDDVLFTPGETRTSQNYPVVPTFIEQQVHAFSLGYQLTDQATLSVLVPYIVQGTDHISSVPGFDEFLLKSDGIGDITTSFSYQHSLSELETLKANVGIQIPVGSINEMGDTPRNGSGTLERLPYTMQIGSGTTDFVASIGYNRKLGDTNLGVSTSSTIRSGLNDNGYRLGNSFSATVSANYQLSRSVVPGVSFSFRHLGEIHGRDGSLLVPMAFPFPASITNPENYGGEKIHTTFNVRACVQKTCRVSLKGEVDIPIYQNLNGVQPKDRHSFSITTAIHF